MKRLNLFVPSFRSGEFILISVVRQLSQIAATSISLGEKHSSLVISLPFFPCDLQFWVFP